MPVLGPSPTRLRDAIRRVVPWWLSDRLESRKTVGFKYVWNIAGILDALLDVILQGMQASWPGVGTADALPYIGRSRGLLRGRDDTDEECGAYYRSWLDLWIRAGSQDGLAHALHHYLPGRPRVRVVNRHGHFVTVNADGTETIADASWDWDSVSNPERAGFWSELWVIIYPTTLRPGGLGDLTGDDGFAIGHLVSRQDVDATLNLLGTWKSAHSKIRAVIWTTDATKFDPASPSSLPDGHWGMWSSGGSGSRVGSHRDYTTCRFWEPTFA